MPRGPVVTADAPSPDVETVAWVMPRQDALDLLGWLRHNRPLGMPDSTFDGLIAALRGAGLPKPSVTEWGVEYERKADPTMDNPSGVITVVQMVRGGEGDARAAVKVGAPLSGTDHRLVKRTVTDWQEATP
jgi:hypothetical protein